MIGNGLFTRRHQPREVLARLRGKRARLASACVLVSLSFCVPARGAKAGFAPIEGGQDVYRGGTNEIVVKPTWYNEQATTELDRAWNLHYYAYMQRHPNVKVRSRTYIQIKSGTGASWLAAWLMPIAAGNPPDIMPLFTGMVHSFARQGFIRPLDEYVGYDSNHNGIIDDDEARWQPWKQIPHHIRLACMHDGHVYALPRGGVTKGRPVVLVYRADLFRAMNLQPPRTWEQFIYCCQRLTQPKLKIQGAKTSMGRRGFWLINGAGIWYPWFYGAGGNVVMQQRTCLRDGTINRWKKEETRFLCKACGHPVTHDRDSNGQRIALESKWVAVFADPLPDGRNPAVEACNLYQTLRWRRWMPCGRCGEPINLAAEQERARRADCGRCSLAIDFDPDRDVIEGMVMIRMGMATATNRNEAFERGEVAMFAWYLSPEELGPMALRPEQIGITTIPTPGPDDIPWTMSAATYQAMTSTVEDKDKRDVLFDLLAAGVTSEPEMTRVRAAAGYYRFMTGQELREAGLEEYLDQVGPETARALDMANRFTRPDLFMEHSGQIGRALATHVFDLIFTDRHLDVEKALVKAQQIANRALQPVEQDRRVARWRWLAWLVVAALFAGFFAMAVYFTVTASRHYTVKSTPSPIDDRPRLGLRRLLMGPVLLLAPAVLSIFLWAYLPLLRGSVMAFQDYRILADSEWVGVDNFLKALLDSAFWYHLWNTFYYVLLVVLMGFAAPIVLALLLSEVPLGKYLFRTIFYLPAVMSPLVVVFLWVMMYHPTEQGFLNQLILSLDRLPAWARAATRIFYGAGLAWLVIALLRWVLRGQWERPIWRGAWGLVALAGVLLLGWTVVRPIIGNLMASIEYGHHPLSWLWAPWGVKAQHWLLDAKWAMPAVILPGVWGGAGPGCLIYLAALKSIPDDSYEAADIDGAGVRAKITNVTLPTLMPLIIINFVGAVIGAFHNVQQILVMTGGGPAGATQTLALDIWFEAFGYLNFGYSTALAWILGSMLIGFTLMQLRILRKVEFRRAGEN